MRTMLRWTVPVEKGNAMIDDGSMGAVIEAVMAKTRPEAAYFLAERGQRSGIFFGSSGNSVGGVVSRPG